MSYEGYDESKVYNSNDLERLIEATAEYLTVSNLGLDPTKEHISSLYEGGTEDILDEELAAWRRVTRPACLALVESGDPFTIYMLAKIATSGKYMERYY